MKHNTAFSFLAILVGLVFLGAGCTSTTPSEQQNTSPITQKTVEQPIAPASLENANKVETADTTKVTTAGWTDGSFEAINFKYPADYTKLINGTAADNLSIVLWTPDQQYAIQISKQNDIKMCLKEICDGSQDLVPLIAEEAFQEWTKGTNPQFTYTQTTIDGHKAIIINQKKANRDGLKSNSVTVLNGKDLYNFSMLATDVELAIFNSLVNTVKFVK